MDFYGFYTGKIFDAYRYLGAHVTPDGVVFRTFAPSASKISVIGEFNGWEESPMAKVHDGNFWEFVSPDAAPGMMYKYRIYDRAGQFIDHCDPYGYGMELRPNTASIIRDMDTYRFHDAPLDEKAHSPAPGTAEISMKFTSVPSASLLTSRTHGITTKKWRIF